MSIQSTIVEWDDLFGYELEYILHHIVDLFPAHEPRARSEPPGLGVTIDLYKPELSGHDVFIFVSQVEDALTTQLGTHFYIRSLRARTLVDDDNPRLEFKVTGW